MSHNLSVTELARQAHDAAFRLAVIPSTLKNEVLLEVAERLAVEKSALQAANERDLTDAKAKGLSAAKLDRLTLSDKVIKDLAQGLKEVVALNDPVGEVVKMWRRPNGLLVGKMRIPLGVVGIVYESRPNVTIEAASLCFKSGNAVILRGGSEAINSNLALADLFTQALKKRNLPPAAVTIIPTTDRRAVEEMLGLEEYIDLIIPRGGEDLIRFVVDKAKMPVIKHYKGVCHIFVDKSADLEMAATVAYNAKVQRPGVCNAMETLLVHRDVAKEFLPKMAAAYERAKVEIRGCPETRKILPQAKPATEEDWPAEYLDLILAVKVVQDLDEAIAHIQRYGSLHTESIITQDYTRAQRFLNEVNSSTVLVNASTRFSDGFQFGLGAEIGISTTKLHAFGPMGLEDLTTTKYIVYGQGQIRE